MSWEIVAALLCLGACTGFLAGLLGIGGGMVLTPFMTMLLVYANVPDTAIVHTAIATSLATIMFTSLSSVRAHHKRGAVLWNVVAAVAPGILVGALLGAKISSLLPTFWISLVFVCFVGFSAVKMFINSKPEPKRTLPGMAGMFGAGTGIGVVSALVGAGGGFISVPFMVWCNVKMHNAVGTSAALGFPIAAAGTLGYIITGWGTRAPAISHDVGLHPFASFIVCGCSKHFYGAFRRQGRPQHRHETLKAYLCLHAPGSCRLHADARHQFPLIFQLRIFFSAVCLNSLCLLFVP